MGELGQNNKYYTPTIEEFHVGFEYEVFDTKYSYEVQHIKEDQYKVLSEPKQVSDWYKEKYTLDRFVYIENSETAYNGLNDYIEDGEIRVKYLDKEDIESLGWEFDKVHSIVDGELPYFVFTKKNYVINMFLYKNPNDRFIRIYKVQRDDFHLKVSEHLRFTGNIKNKSELKVLLNQLGIC